MHGQSPLVRQWILLKTLSAQKLTRQKDASLLAEFDLSTTEEIKRWLLSFSQQAVVLEPMSLRGEMASELQATWNQYQAAPSRQTAHQKESYS